MLLAVFAGMRPRGRTCRSCDHYPLSVFSNKLKDDKHHADYWGSKKSRFVFPSLNADVGGWRAVRLRLRVSPVYFYHCSSYWIVGVQYEEQSG